jgi:hypothetical protein
MLPEHCCCRTRPLPHCRISLLHRWPSHVANSRALVRCFNFIYTYPALLVYPAFIHVKKFRFGNCLSSIYLQYIPSHARTSMPKSSIYVFMPSWSPITSCWCPPSKIQSQYWYKYVLGSQTMVFIPIRFCHPYYRPLISGLHSFFICNLHLFQKYLFYLKNVNFILSP